MITLLLCLNGCSDEEIVPDIGTQAYILKLYAPDMMQVGMTRAVNETRVTGLHVYADETAIAHFSGTDIKEAGQKGELLNKTINLKPTVSNLMATANEEEINGGTVLSSTLLPDNLLPMWGVTAVDHSQKTITINLKCSVAKVTITAAPESGKTIELADPTIYNTHSKGFLVHRDIDGLSVPAGSELQTAGIRIENDGTYIFPTKKESKPRIIVKCGPYFYPIEFHAKEGPLDLLPNHWYEVKVTAVTGKGYETLDDAKRYPSLNIITEIIDHKPVIFDMVANGKDELGVCDTVRIKAGEEGDATVEATATVFTTYNPDDPTIDENGKFTTRLTCIQEESDTWLTVGTSPTCTPGSGQGAAGFLYTYTLTAPSNPSTIERRATLTYKVGLLEKKLVVIQEGNSVENALNSSNRKVELWRENKIDKSPESYRITADYFTSLHWRDNPSPAIPIYGALPEDMQGVSRVGLLFNIIKTKDEKDNYGYFISGRKDTDLITLYDGTGKHWTYAANDGNNIIVDKSTDDKGSAYIGINATYGGGYFYIWLINRDINHYYGRTDMKVVITEKGKNEGDPDIIIEIPIYATGVLTRLDGSNGQIVPAEDSPKEGWYYYEFVKEQDYYIFDRNIGARSNGPYSDENESGDTDAIGAWFYKQYKTWMWKNNKNYYQGIEEPQKSISDSLGLMKATDLSLAYESSLWGTKICSNPYLESTGYNPFKVYIPLIKYLYGHAWQDWTSDGHYELHIADGHKRGYSGYYWREEQKATGGELDNTHFYWNIYQFTSSGYSYGTIRSTEGDGGRTDPYYGLQARPIYKKRQ